MDFTQKDVINCKERFNTRKLEPKIDETISKLVGRKVYQQDPRLLKLLVKWKGSKPEDSMEADNFFNDPMKIIELKQVLTGSL